MFQAPRPLPGRAVSDKGAALESKCLSYDGEDGALDSLVPSAPIRE